jgi:hypothetical protein
MYNLLPGATLRLEHKLMVGSPCHHSPSLILLGLDLADLVSRAPLRRTAGSAQWEVRHTSTFKVAGRHTLNLWRILRVEITLSVYTFENAVFNVLKQR